MNEPTDTYPPALSVVMATLGGECLKETIEQLNRGSVVPAEILVCIPEREAPRTAVLDFPNVKVIVTKCRGQVPQRAIGFQSASHEVVMQLDDDIHVEPDAVARMLRTLVESGPRAAVAANLIGTSAAPFAGINRKVMGLFYFLVNGWDGYRMGTVSKAGTEISVKADDAGARAIDVEWMPGGCVMHWRENLIKENFFPYPGKAYCEDLLHSHLLAEKGIALKLDPGARCFFTSFPTDSFGVSEFIRNLRGDYRARKYFVGLSSRSLVRMHLYYACVALNFFFKKLVASSHG